MNCQKFQMQLDAYRDDRLDEADRVLFRDHLASCLQCRAVAIAHDPTFMFVGIPTRDTDPTAVQSCVDAVSAMVRQDRLERRLQPRRRSWLAAAAAVLVVLTGSVFWHFAPVSSSESGLAPTFGPVLAAAPGQVEPPRVEVDMNTENLRVYQFSDAGDENTAVYFIVNEAMEL